MSDNAQLSKLRQELEKHFDEDELKTLCQDLGVGFDDLPGQGRANKARELVAFMDRRGQLDELERKLAAYKGPLRPPSGKKRPIWPWLLVAAVVVALVVWIVSSGWGQPHYPPTYPTQAPSEPQQPIDQPVVVQPAPAQAPEILVEGDSVGLTGSVSGLYHIDLDKDKSSSVTVDQTKEQSAFTDIQVWSEASWLVEPKNGAQAAKVGSRLGYDGCSTQPLSSAIIPLTDADIIPGVWFCVRTTDGHFSEFRLQKVNTGPFDFAFGYRTWK